MTAPSPDELVERLERVLKRLARDLDSKAAVAARTEGLERAEAPIASDAEALRAAAALIRELVGRERVLAEFVRHVAKQPTADEMDEDYYEAADFEGAYGAIIDEARRAAKALEAK